MSHIEQISIRVDHLEPLVAAGLVAILGEQPGLCVKRVPRSGGPSRDAVLVADYETGLRHLAQAANALASGEHAAEKVVIVTPRTRAWDVRPALDAGVHGYLPQGCEPQELVHAVRTVGAGSRYLCPSVAQSVVDSLSHTALTGREREVLQLLARGHCNKTIARELGVAIGTVKAHVRCVFDKLHASSRTQAVVNADRLGLVAA